MTGRLDREFGAQVFGRDPAGYHAGRVGYPDALYRAIAERTGAVDRILEIGAGTGLATEALLRLYPEARLVAVEADEHMAQHLRSALTDPRLDVVVGDFSVAPLTPGFDLAACAAAFHWLEPSSALKRLRGLLNPRGVLAIWWNSYRNTGIGDAFADAAAPLLEGIDLPPSEGPSRHYSLDVALHQSALARAGFVEIETHIFRRERRLSATDLRALYASYSYVRALPASRREALLDELAALGRGRFGEAIPNVVVSAIYTALAPD